MSRARQALWLLLGFVIVWLWIAFIVQALARSRRPVVGSHAARPPAVPSLGSGSRPLAPPRAAADSWPPFAPPSWPSVADASPSSAHPRLLASAAAWPSQPH